MIYQLKSDVLTASFCSHGAELRSLKRNADSREYMWNRDPVFWGRTSPVLFPVVGALKDGGYIYKGRRYEMGQHGFARDREFEMIACSQSEISFRLRADAQSLRVYPFLFVLTITYILEGMTLHVRWQVKNEGQETMYFSIGAHPAFLYPDGQLPYLIFDSSTLSYRLLRDGLVTPEHYSLPLEQGCFQVQKDTFDLDALIVEGKQNGCVKLADTSRCPFLQVSFDSPLYGLWSPAGKNAPFLCIEPWWGRCDCVDFEGTLDQRDYTNSLAPGAVFEAGYTIGILEERQQKG